MQNELRYNSEQLDVTDADDSHLGEGISTDSQKKQQRPPKNDSSQTADRLQTENCSEELQEKLGVTKAELAKKEQLVVTLTNQLEQLAEQLDRERRTGKHRKTNSKQIQFPPEIIQEQREVTGDLQRAVQQWEDLQTGTTLGRLEVQLAELRDLITDNSLHSSPPQNSSPQQTAHETSSSSASPSTGSSSGEQSETRSDAPTSYEMMKANLLSGNPADVQQSPQSQNHPTEESTAGQPTAEEPTADATLQPTDNQPVDETCELPQTLPTAVIFASANEDDLQKAIEVRDQYVSYLTQKLRKTESCPILSGSWNDLENVPDELRSRLEEQEQQLQEALRIAEVENSLERARLGREATRLELLEQQLQKELKQFGLGADSSDSHHSQSTGETNEKEQRKQKRWQRLLGIKNKDE